MYIMKEGDMSSNVLVVVHGLGEHSERYRDLVRRILRIGYGVITFDLPGHGRSPGIRGHAPLKKILKVLDNIVSELPNPPVLFGHSLGGLVVARYVESGGRSRAIILSSPGLDYDKSKVPDSLVKLAKFLSLVVPFLPMDNRIDPDKLSRNKDAVKRYVEDPLVHRKISVALARDFFVESQKAIEEAGKINVPVLVLIGTADEVTPPEGAKRFFQNLKVRDKKLVEFEGGYHELFEDPEHSEGFYEEITKFLKKVYNPE